MKANQEEEEVETKGLLIKRMSRYFIELMQKYKGKATRFRRQYSFLAVQYRWTTGEVKYEMIDAWNMR